MQPLDPTKQSSDTLLCGEILNEARREGERLIQQAREEAESLMRRTLSQEENTRKEQLETARQNVTRHAEQILATVPIETERLRRVRLESELNTILDEVHRKLLAREGFDYSESLVSCATEAIRRMDGNAFVIKLSPEDHAAYAGALTVEIPNRSGRPLVTLAFQDDPTITEGGLMVLSGDGHQQFDARFSAKLARLWPTLRRQLASSSPPPRPPSRPPPSPVTPSSSPFITRISGPVVNATGLTGVKMYDVVQVGEQGLTGEIVRLVGGNATIQVYEDTTLLKPGAPVHSSGAPLSVWLGPGLIGNIYDGIQRPLPTLNARSGAWIRRGEKVAPLDVTKLWPFEPVVHPGETVTAGQTFGHVAETPLVRHRLMVPPGISGTIHSIIPAGNVTLTDTVAVINTATGPHPLTLLQKWPVRIPRPVLGRSPITTPLITGQRIIDTFFPIGKGGCAAIPGGFGTGKTITQHQLAKWSDADIIVFIGCGERGNEMTEVLREFPKLRDPRSGRPLMERTILIANTSNMPVAAREVSIYTGITLAEYYRDMGLHVAVFADSTSRWAEALRELAARLEEMPAEEGFPASLPTRLAQFYERGGSVTTLAGDQGSVSIVGAVSPPGGDFSEPVTQHTQRFIRCFWALDTDLANARHYPSVHWLRSYSDYISDISAWWKARTPEWLELRTEALTLLQREDRLQQIVRLVGADALPENQRLILFIAEVLKDGFLAQNAFDEKDMYCSPERQAALLQLIMAVYRKSQDLIQAGVPLEKIHELPGMPHLIRAKSVCGNDDMESLAELGKRLHAELDALTPHS